MEELKKITLNDVPGGYAMCSRDDCAVCNHCLRHIAFQEVGKDLKMLYQVNPLRIVPSDKCEYFRTDEPATYARGFKNMQQSMTPPQYQTFSCRLIGKFGRTGYFERRRGERLCSPSEIEAIRNVLQEIGLPDLEFDGYQKQYNWWD